MNRVIIYGDLEKILNKEQFENEMLEMKIEIKHENDKINDLLCSLLVYEYTNEIITDVISTKNKNNAKISLILIKYKNLDLILQDNNYINQLKDIKEKLKQDNDNIQIIIVGIKSKKLVVDEQSQRFEEIMNPNYQKNKKKNIVKLSEKQIEQMLINLQFEIGLNITYCNDTTNYIKWLKCTLKSGIRSENLTLAEKQTRNNIFTLEKLSSIKIQPNSEKWLEKLWFQQLTQFRSIDEDIARSIVKFYPTMFDLKNEIIKNNFNTNFLENLTIEKGYGIFAKKTKLGLTIASQIVQVLTSLDPYQYVL